VIYYITISIGLGLLWSNTAYRVKLVNWRRFIALFE